MEERAQHDLARLLHRERTLLDAVRSRDEIDALARMFELEARSIPTLARAFAHETTRDDAALSWRQHDLHAVGERIDGELRIPTAPSGQKGATLARHRQQAAEHATLVGLRE